MNKHKLAGQTVILKIGDPDPEELNLSKFRIEDYWINVTDGESWMFCDGNPACMKYGMRSGLAGLPTDDKVIYGKIGSLGYLVHESEIGDVAKQ